eukprot:2580977-Pleurochrysis_carterae.AAC.1
MHLRARGAELEAVCRHRHAIVRRARAREHQQLCVTGRSESARSAKRRRDDGDEKKCPKRACKSTYPKAPCRLPRDAAWEFRWQEHRRESKEPPEVGCPAETPVQRVPQQLRRLPELRAKENRRERDVVLARYGKVNDEREHAHRLSCLWRCGGARSCELPQGKRDEEPERRHKAFGGGVRRQWRCGAVQRGLKHSGGCLWQTRESKDPKEQQKRHESLNRRSNRALALLRAREKHKRGDDNVGADELQAEPMPECRRPKRRRANLEHAKERHP